MATHYNLSVVAPDRTIVDENVEATIAPAFDGYLGVMAGHEPMIVALRPGVLEFLDSRDLRHHVAVGSGFMEISNKGVIVLADDAVLARDIDIRDEQQRLDQARKALRGEHSTMTADDATHELERAMVRIRAARAAGNSD